MVALARSYPIPQQVPIRRALLSVTDKTGLVDFARALAERGVALVSSGGTRRALSAAGVETAEVEDVTGFPEMLGGRVKTLHPRIHGGILAIRDDPDHAEAIAAEDIPLFDLVVVNLYPFPETVASGAAEADVVENIDIGGPALIRAAAKNHAYVSVVVDPADYEPVLKAMAGNDGSVPWRLRRQLAAKAFGLTAAYDCAVSDWFSEALGEEMPERRSFTGILREKLRYGENPHQLAGFYVTGSTRPGVATARQVQGKQLSYNNIADIDAAYELVAEFDPQATAAVAIIKHANPCGVATGATISEAYEKALRCDPVSAFGGIVAVNRQLNTAAAGEIVRIFTEAIIAPDATPGAEGIIAGKKNLRLLIAGGLPDPRDRSVTVRSVSGGLLVQERDAGEVTAADLRVVTRRAPTEAELADLLFAFRVCKHVKSNAIVYAKDGATVGIGAGQMSRVDAAMIAARKAADAAREAGREESLAVGSVVASDAFFPFPDGLIAAVEAGATAVIQPGGSVNDDKVIAAADERGIAMVFTGMRHFRH